MNAPKRSLAPRIRPASPETAPVLAIQTGRPVDASVAERRREERLLVDAVLAGEPDAFARLYTLYAPRLHRFAVGRLGGDATEAEDVVQDVFLEVHRCLGAWEGRSALLTWMFGIAHHQLCRRFRRRTPLGLPPERIEAMAGAAAAGSPDGRVDAMRALDACADVLEQDVSEAQREIFDRFYGDGAAVREIAREVGKSKQAVKIGLFRTRRAMESRLAESGLMQSA